MEQLEPGVRLVRANNPSPMTYTGTNTYLLGRHHIAVIDPGPNDTAHLEAILAAVPEGAKITHILVTHAHLDHSPLARVLAKQTGAPVYAMGDSRTGRSAIMEQLAASGLMGGGEGVDPGFIPDEVLQDGTILESPDWQIEAIHTPGHFGNHMSFALQGIVFTGDHVMGWASSLVSPPDGDLTQFMASCAVLKARPARVFYAGHGDPITDPQARLDWLIAHRKTREAQIIEALRPTPATTAILTKAIYTDVDPRLLPAAERNVLAHLIDLTQRGIAAPQGALSADVPFALQKP
ncbi:MBL fold metallo-hydrolase [Cognatishimia sp. MH4019]|uniref:MBL fold metallo-hydrolase n=1 Tax=Cognatishimia sp. MH4019 TaxID=2854030 RepID=UPI001CD61CDB|nr:MBL fold metallo-hydrolase [Cognatishimia sp. MH4019]